MKYANTRCEFNGVWIGTQATLDLCHDACAGYQFTTWVARGDQNCACQQACIKVPNDECDLYENEDA